MIELDEFILNSFLFYLFVLLDILPKNQFAANPTKSRKKYQFERCCIHTWLDFDFYPALKKRFFEASVWIMSRKSKMHRFQKMVEQPQPVWSFLPKSETHTSKKYTCSLDQAPIFWWAVDAVWTQKAPPAILFAYFGSHFFHCKNLKNISTQLQPTLPDTKSWNACNSQMRSNLFAKGQSSWPTLWPSHRSMLENQG